MVNNVQGKNVPFILDKFNKYVVQLRLNCFES